MKAVKLSDEQARILKRCMDLGGKCLGVDGKGRPVFWYPHEPDMDMPERRFAIRRNGGEAEINEPIEVASVWKRIA